MTVWHVLHVVGGVSVRELRLPADARCCGLWLEREAAGPELGFVPGAAAIRMRDS